MTTPKAKTLIEHLEAVESKWLEFNWKSDCDGGIHYSYTHVDYPALLREIDAFTESLKK